MVRHGKPPAGRALHRGAGRELRQVLEAMGQKPTEEELFQMISEVDDNMSGSIGVPWAAHGR